MITRSGHDSGSTRFPCEDLSLLLNTVMQRLLHILVIQLLHISGVQLLHIYGMSIVAYLGILWLHISDFCIFMEWSYLSPLHITLSIMCLLWYLNKIII